MNRNTQRQYAGLYPTLKWNSYVGVRKENYFSKTVEKKNNCKKPHCIETKTVGRIKRKIDIIFHVPVKYFVLVSPSLITNLSGVKHWSLHSIWFDDLKTVNANRHLMTSLRNFSLFVEWKSIYPERADLM